MPRIGIDITADSIQSLNAVQAEVQHRISATEGSIDRGAWAQTTAYVVGDYVTYIGRLYAAIAPSTGIRPSATVSGGSASTRRTISTKWIALDDNSNPWIQDAPQTPSTTLFIDNVEQGVHYDVRVRYWLADGSVTDWASIISHKVVGKSLLPSDVTGFTVIALGYGLARAGWNAVVDPDIDYYEIRIGASWAAGTAIVRTKSPNVILSGLAVGSYVYRIKAVDTAGNYSLNDVSTTITIVTSTASSVISLAGTANQIQVSSTVGSVTLSLAGPFNVSSLTNHGVILGRGVSPIGALVPPADNGYVLGSGLAGADPQWRQLVAGTGIDITVVGASITITNVGGGGGAPGSVTSLTGTPNEVLVSTPTGDVVLSLPQDIDTAADVQFGTLMASGAIHGFGAGGDTRLYVGYASSIDLSASGTTGVGMMLHSAATGAGSIVGDLAFGTSGTAAADKRAALVRGALDQASGTNVYGRLDFYVNTNNSWTRGMYIGAGGVVVIGSLQLPTSATAGDLFYASSANLMDKLSAGANNTVLMSQGAGLAPIWRGGTNGQLLIGNGTGFARTTLTAGSGITITNGAGTITITAPGGGGAVAGVSSITGTANQVLASAATGPVVISTPQDIDTGADFQVGTLRVGAYANNQTLVQGTRFTDTAPTGSFIDMRNHAGTSLFKVDVTGTVTAGVWNGTVLDEVYGGTGQSGYTTGDLLYASGATTLAKLAAGTDGYVLTSQGAGVAPHWEAVPTVGVTSLAGTANQIQVSAATGAVTLSLVGPYTPATYTAHGILLGQGTGSITALGPAAAGYYLRSGGAASNPGWSTLTLPNTVAKGDILAATAANQVAVIGAGTLNWVLTAQGAGNVPIWAAPSGGVGLDNPATAAKGDLIVATDVNTLGNLVDVAAGSYLRSGGVNLVPGWSTLTLPNTAATGDLLMATGTNVVGVRAAVAAGQLLVSQGLTTAPAWTPNPTITATANGQNILSIKRFDDAGPTGYYIRGLDSTGAVTVFSISTQGALVVNQLTSFSIDYPTSIVAGGVLVGTSVSQIGHITPVDAGSYLRSNGAAAVPVWSTTTLPNTTAAGDLLMATGTNVVGVRAAVAVGQVLTSAGVSTAPVWSASPYLSTGILAGVTGGAAVATGQFKSDSNSSNNVAALVSNAAASSIGPTIALRHARGAIGAETATQSGDVLGMLYFEGFGDTVWAGLNVGSNIRSLATEAHTDTARGSDLRFYTVTAGGVAVTEALRLVGANITVGNWQGSSIDTAYTDAKVVSVSGTTNRISIGGTAGAPTVDIHTSYVGQNSITTLGTIATGIWHGTSIGTGYTDAKVVSVAGTTNRISIGGTAGAPTVDIDASYVGQNTITTLGTIATGVWQGSAVGAGYGGTGQLGGYAIGDLLYASGASTLSKRAAVALGQVFISQGVTTAPVWSATMFLSGTHSGIGETSQTSLTGYAYPTTFDLVGATTGIPALVLQNGAIGISQPVGQVVFGSVNIPGGDERLAIISGNNFADGTAAPYGGIDIYTTNGAAPARTFRHGPALGTSSGITTALNGATANYLSFGTVGQAAPADDSVGAKIQLYGTVGSIAVATNYMIGAASANLWFSAPGSYSLYQYINAAVGAYPTWTSTPLSSAFYGVVANRSGDILSAGRCLGYFTRATMPCYINTVMGDTPAVFLRLNEASGNVADTTANANNGTVTGSPTYQAVGPVLYDSSAFAITLSGTGQYITVATSATMPTGSNVCFEVWFKRSATQGAIQYLFSQKTNGLYLRFNAANNLELGQVGGSVITTTAATYTSTSVWYHAAAVSDGSGNFSIVVNGVATTAQSIATLTPADGTLYIGCSSAAGNLFPGSIAELAGYSPAATFTQLWEHYQEGTCYKNGRVGYISDAAHVRNVTRGSGSGAGAFCLYENNQWNGLSNIVDGAFAIGDLLYASGTGTLNNLADVAVGSYLRSGGVGAAPLWSTLILPNAANQGDIVVATSADHYGAVAAVAVGRVLVSGGASTVPAYSATPTLGVAGTTQGSLTLSGVTAGTVTFAVPANVTSSYSLTVPAAPPAQGALLYFSNATGTLAGLADVAVNQVLVSGGVNTVPAWSASPVLTQVTADIKFATALGAAGTTTLCTLGKTGGAGAPATATMAGWQAVKCSDNSTAYVPIWK